MKSRGWHGGGGWTHPHEKGKTTIIQCTMEVWGTQVYHMAEMDTPPPAAHSQALQPHSEDNRSLWSHSGQRHLLAKVPTCSCLIPIRGTKRRRSCDLSETLPRPPHDPRQPNETHLTVSARCPLGAATLAVSRFRSHTLTPARNGSAACAHARSERRLVRDNGGDVTGRTAPYRPC